MAATLPPNWSRYTTDEGKEYFHNSVTNSTQWERPEWPAGMEAPSSLDAAGTAEVYQYKPTSNELELQPTTNASDTGGPGSPGAAVSAFESVSLSPSGKGGSTLGGVNLSGTVTPMVGMAGSAGSSSGAPKQTDAQDSGAEGATSCFGCCGWVLSYLQRQFDVTTDDVVQRIKLALMPFKAGGGGENVFRERPDFWGPFWICTTAVLLMPASANFSLYVRAIHLQKEFGPQYGLVSVAATMLYGCLFGVPALIRLAFLIAGSEGQSMDLRQLICVYGYSFASTVPVCLLCSLIAMFLASCFWIQFIVVLAGLAIAVLFMLKNLWPDVPKEVPCLKFYIVGSVVCAQVLIFLIYAFFFLWN